MLPTSDLRELPPAFGIVVYVRRDDDGRVFGRAANLDDVSATAATERELFQKILPICKAAIRAALDTGITQPLLETPLPMLADEQKRYFPLHL